MFPANSSYSLHPIKLKLDLSLDHEVEQRILFWSVKICKVASIKLKLSSIKLKLSSIELKLSSIELKLLSIELSWSSIELELSSIELN